MMITRCVLAVSIVLAGACGVMAQDVRGYIRESVIFAQDQQSIVEVRSGRGFGIPPMPLRRMALLIEIDKERRLARFFRFGGPFGDKGVLREVPFAKDVTFSLDYLPEIYHAINDPAYGRPASG